MAEQLTVQEDCFKAWCESWGPGTYDKLTQEEKEALRHARRELSFHRRLAIVDFLRDIEKRGPEIREALWGKKDA